MSTFCDRYGPWAVVTGASGGLGCEFTRQLAALGLNVVLVARGEDEIEKLAADVENGFKIETLCISVDLTSEKGLEHIISVTENLDVGLLVNNAGILYIGSFFRQEPSDYSKLIALNVTAVTTLAHAFGRRLIKRGKGGILFVASVSKDPRPWMAAYCGSKAFAANLAYILRMELASYGINVMSLEPGLIDTDMTENNLQQIDMFANTPKEVVKDGLDAFEKGCLRITPQQERDPEADNELLKRLEKMSSKMTAQMDSKLFQPNL